MYRITFKRQKKKKKKKVLKLPQIFRQAIMIRVNPDQTVHRETTAFTSHPGPFRHITRELKGMLAVI